MHVDQFPQKGLGVRVNLFANKFKVWQHRDRKRYADVAYYGLYDGKNSKIELIFNKLSENIYIMGVSVDSLHTILVGTQTPVLLPCNLKCKGVLILTRNTTWEARSSLSLTPHVIFLV